jgi:hypothetical protein
MGCVQSKVDAEDACLGITEGICEEDFAIPGFCDFE